MGTTGLIKNVGHPVIRGHDTMATHAALGPATVRRIGGRCTAMAASDAPRQSRDRMLPLFRRIEILFATRYREILHADLRRCLTLPAVPEAAATQVISEAEVVVGVEDGGMIVGTEGETVVILISESAEIRHIGTTAVASVSAPNGAIAKGIALEGVDPRLAHAHHSGEIFETLETRATVLLV